MSKSTILNVKSEINEKSMAQQMEEIESKRQKQKSELEKVAVKTFESFSFKKFLMEFTGSFALVYFGNWSQIFNDLDQSNLTAVALSVGIIVTIFTWIGVDISGAHYNPVTTVTNF